MLQSRESRTLRTLRALKCPKSLSILTVVEIGARPCGFLITLADDVVRNSLKVQVVKTPHGRAPISTTVNMDNDFGHFSARSVRSVLDSLDCSIHQLAKL